MSLQTSSDLQEIHPESHLLRVASVQDRLGCLFPSSECPSTFGPVPRMGHVPISGTVLSPSECSLINHLDQEAKDSSRLHFFFWNDLSLPELGQHLSFLHALSCSLAIYLPQANLSSTSFLLDLFSHLLIHIISSFSLTLPSVPEAGRSPLPSSSCLCLTYG